MYEHELMEVKYYWNIQIRNARGHLLQCSHYMPSPFPGDTELPCVIYCHGNRLVMFRQRECYTYKVETEFVSPGK